MNTAQPAIRATISDCTCAWPFPFSCGKVPLMHKHGPATSHTPTVTVIVATGGCNWNDRTWYWTYTDASGRLIPSQIPVRKLSNQAAAKNPPISCKRNGPRTSCYYLQLRAKNGSLTACEVYRTEVQGRWRCIFRSRHTELCVVQ